MRSIRSPRRPFVIGLLFCALSGCYTLDASLDRDGSGSLTLDYIPPLHATIDSETARYSSPHITVQSVSPRRGGATLKATFDDVTQLSGAEAFKDLTVVRDRKRGQERLRIRMRNPAPKQIRENAADDPRVTLTLPGRVLQANASARIEGNRVSWRLPLNEWARSPVTELKVRYRVAPPA